MHPLNQVVLFVCLFFKFLAVPHGTWDVSSLEAQSLNHWTAREVPKSSVLIVLFKSNFFFFFGHAECLVGNLSFPTMD